MRSSENIKDVLPYERRGCIFFDETHDLKLFKEYGMRSCLFECMFNGAVDYCKCIPWNYPQLGNESNICDSTGNACFSKQMTNGTVMKSCDCLSNCHSTSYPHFVNIEKIDPVDCVSNNSTNGTSNMSNKISVHRE